MLDGGEALWRATQSLEQLNRCSCVLGAPVYVCEMILCMCVKLMEGRGCGDDEQDEGKVRVSPRRFVNSNFSRKKEKCRHLSWLSAKFLS